MCPFSPPSETVSEIHVILAHWSTKWRGLAKVWVLELKGTTHQNYIFILAYLAPALQQQMIKAGWSFMKMVSTDFWVVLIVSHLLWLFTRSEKRLSEIEVGGSKPQGYFMGFKQKKEQMAHFKCHFIENIFCLKLLPHIKYVLLKMNYSKCVSHDILMTVHSTKFIIIYLCQSREGDTIGRHYTKTLCSDFTGNWFFYKEKIKSSKEASISKASSHPVNDCLVVTDSLGLFFIFTINYFLEEGKHKAFYYR